MNYAQLLEEKSARLREMEDRHASLLRNYEAVVRDSAERIAEARKPRAITEGDCRHVLGRFGYELTPVAIAQMRRALEAIVLPSDCEPLSALEAQMAKEFERGREQGLREAAGYRDANATLAGGITHADVVKAYEAACDDAKNGWVYGLLPRLTAALQGIYDRGAQAEKAALPKAEAKPATTQPRAITDAEIDALIKTACSCYPMMGAEQSKQNIRSDVRRALAAFALPDSEATPEPGAWRQVDDGAFAMPFGTIRKCRECGCLVAGGPTACGRCASANHAPVRDSRTTAELLDAVTGVMGRDARNQVRSEIAELEQRAKESR